MILTVRSYLPTGLERSGGGCSIDTLLNLELLPSRYPPEPYPQLVRLRGIDPSLGLIEIRASIDFYGVAPTTLDLSIRHRVDLLSVDCVDRPTSVETVHDIEAFVPASHFETLAVWRPEIALGVTEDEWRKMLAAPDDPCPAEGTVFDWQHGDLVRS